jgi:hypothetical protein
VRGRDLFALINAVPLLVAVISKIAPTNVPPIVTRWVWPALGITIFISFINEIRKSKAVEVSTPSQLDLAAEQLVRTTRYEWQAEADIRGLLKPAPLRVSWVVRRRALESGSEQVAFRQTTPSYRSIDEYITYLSKQYEYVPSGRLVITGEPGAGKSAQAVLLTLGLLKTWERGGPVPVFLSLAAWDLSPSAELVDMNAWIERRVLATYSFLRNTEAYGATAAKDLVQNKKLIPILDGLDEVPENLRRKVIELLNKTTGPVVVSCRTEQEEIIEGNWTTVELREPDASDVAAWLSLSCESEEQKEKSENLLAELSNNPKGTLAAALRTPLFASLVRTAYVTGNLDPRPLVKQDKFKQPEDIQSHLLREFVPAAYERPTVSPPSGLKKTRYPAWGSERACRWLEFIAREATRNGTRDLAWWRIHRAVPQTTYSFTIGVISALMYGFTRELPAGLTRGFAIGVTVAVALAITRNCEDPSKGALVAGLVSASMVALIGNFIVGSMEALREGLEFGFAVGLAIKFIKKLRGDQKKSARDRGTLLRTTLLVCLIGFGDGVVVGLTYLLTNNIGVGLHYVVTVGLAVTFGMGISVWCVAMLVSSSAPASPSPRNFRLRGRSAPLLPYLSVGIAAGSAVGVAGGVVGTFRENFQYGLALAITFGIIAGVPIGLTGGLIRWFNEPSKAMPAASPQSTLRGDRAVGLISITLVGLVGGLATGVVGDSVFVLLNVHPPGGIYPVNGLKFGLCLGIVVATSVTAWPSFFVGHIWLVLTRHLPLRLIAFFEDAHQRNILRKEGAVYQFRHIEVQNEFARIGQGICHGESREACTTSE